MNEGGIERCVNKPPNRLVERDLDLLLLPSELDSPPPNMERYCLSVTNVPNKKLEMSSRFPSVKENWRKLEINNITEGNNSSGKESSFKIERKRGRTSVVQKRVNI
jgi:hypothetical protein